MLHKAVEQFLGDVYWGDLDFLLADLPPGTGDVSISLASFLPGAQMLVVTTPQDAARKVAERAGRMAERTNLRPIGVIENMSYYVCPHCGEQERIFGEGGGREAAATLAVPLLAEVPLMKPLREGGDEGTPIVVSDPDAPASVALIDAATAIARTSKSRVGKPLTIRPTGALATANGGNGHGAHAEHAGHAEHQHPGHEGHDHSAHDHAAHAGHQH
jgi:ATP-binding protein involved in chromosome partitioning